MVVIYRININESIKKNNIQNLLQYISSLEEKSNEILECS